MKKIFGIIGWPVKHSLSPAMHNSAFKDLDIEASYELFEVKPEDLKNFINRVRRENISGLSVTTPHKVAVMQCLDEIDDKSKAIGAVNTVINQSGYLKGTNTDCDGSIQALVETQNFVSLRNQRIIVFGAGGAARAVVYGLYKEGAKVVMLNRTLDHAQEIANRYGFKADTISNISQYSADIIINTTPIGMSPKENESIVPSDFLKPGQIVFDMVYRPKLTKLIISAQKKGCVTVTGDRMLLHQGVKQFELLIGKKAPIKAMEIALARALND